MAGAALDASLVCGHNLPPPGREFVIDGADGATQIGTNGRTSLTIEPHGQGKSRMRKRNAIKHACTPRVRREQWLYGELDGVRCYVKDDDGQVHVVMTKRDLYP